MNNNIETIVLHAQKVENGNQSFIACSAEIRGRWFKIKFNKTCEGAPTERGLYDLTFNFDDCSVENGRIYTRNNGDTGISNDTIWIKKIIELRKYSETELAEMNRANMCRIFGRESEDIVRF